MQFRIQARRVQCIRATYDPAIQRSRQVVVASFNRWSDSIPTDEVAALTDAERAKLASWWSAHRAAQDALFRQVNLTQLGLRLAELVEDVENAADGELSAVTAETAWEQLARMQKALKRAGFPRPTKAAKPARPAPAGQGDLLGDQG